MTAELKAIHLSQVNENCVLLSFTDEISMATTACIASAAEAIRNAHANQICDCVPAYTTLLIYFDNQRIQGEKFCALLTRTLTCWQREYARQENHENTTTLVEIPVYYAAEVAPDLLRLAESKQLTVDELVALHLQTTYTVYVVGFAPGFAYMGDVDLRIAEPRLSTPRARVAKGSVGIAGKQTGIYPQALPGGWNIIGRSPLDLFSIDEAGNPLCPYQVGDRVKFFAITHEEFVAQGGEL